MDGLRDLTVHEYNLSCIYLVWFDYTFNNSSDIITVSHCTEYVQHQNFVRFIKFSLMNSMEHLKIRISVNYRSHFVVIWELMWWLPVTWLFPFLLFCLFFFFLPFLFSFYPLSSSTTNSLLFTSFLAYFSFSLVTVVIVSICLTHAIECDSLICCRLWSFRRQHRSTRHCNMAAVIPSMTWKLP